MKELRPDIDFAPPGVPSDASERHAAGTRPVASRRRLMLGASGGVTLLGLGSILPARAWWWKDDEDEVPEIEARHLGWEDLMPAGFVPPPDPTMDMSIEELDKLFDGSAESNMRLQEIDEAMRYAPVEPSLDGQHVTLPGYVVPLDFDGQTRMKEFLLVPYFGACIHTPPPPANQIVMATLDRPTEVGDGWSPVRLRGIMRTEERQTDLAETGYTIEVLAIDPVEAP